MKRFAFLCLLLVALPVHAQDNVLQTPEQRAERKEMLERLRQEAREQMAMMKKITPYLAPLAPRITSGEKTLSLVFMNESFTHDEFLAYTGLTEAKAIEIKQKIGEILEKGQEQLHSNIRDEIKITDDPGELDDLANRFIEGTRRIMAAQDDVFHEELTPQQLGKFKELRLILSASNTGIEFMFDFGQYETLDLTDEQQAKIDTIRKEYEREFPPLLEKLFALQMKKMEQVIEAGSFDPPSNVDEEREEAEARNSTPGFGQ